MMRRLLLILAFALAGQPASLSAQSLDFRSVAQMLEDRRRLATEAFQLADQGKNEEVFARVRDLVQAERELVTFLEKTFPVNEQYLPYYGTAIVLRGSLASNLRWLAGLNESRGDLAAALAEARELSALDGSLYGTDHWETADARRLIADLEQLLASDSDTRREIAEAKALNRQVLRFAEAGKWLESFPMAEQALAIRGRILGAGHPEFATSLSNLAGSYDAIGDYTRAESLYRRALEIRTRVLGDHHPHTANSLNNLGYLYLRMGDYARATPLVQRALEVNRETRGAAHPDTAASLANLAASYYEQGDFEKAAPLFEEDLETTRRIFGEEHPRHATCLNNLAGLAMARGDLDRAGVLYAQAIEIRRRTLGEQHPLYAASLNNLAALYHERGDYDRAGPLYRRSLEIRRQTTGERSLDFALGLGNLAELLLAQGDAGLAEPLSRQALEIRRAVQGESHPFTALMSSRLSLMLAAQGRWEEAAGVMDRSRRALRSSIGRVLPSLSNRDRLSFLWGAYKSSYRSALAYGPAKVEGQPMAERSAGWLLNGKAVVEELLAERDLSALESNDPEVLDTLRKLRAVRTELSKRTLAGITPGREAEDQQELTRLGQQDQELSRTLGQIRGRPARDDDWVEVDEVRERLAADSILVEIGVWDLLDIPRNGRRARGTEPHYAAWIVPPRGQGNVQVIDLGPAEPIEAAVDAFRKSINGAARSINERGEEASEAEVKGLLEAIARQVLRPLEPVLSRSKRWLISPDAGLWHVPWGALPLEDGTYAVHRHAIRYLVSGRDLVERTPETVASRGGLVVADPDFDREALPRLGAKTGPATRSTSAPLPFDWPRLPGTAEEAAAVLPKMEAFLGSRPTLFTGAEATEGTIKAARRPRVVLLSTHGYFLKDQDFAAPPAPGQPASGAITGLMPIENPLLRSGLILAGANPRDRATDPDGEDGVLTSLEIVGLDLRGTELVVLSACETGRGVIHSGEGVAGLRQAFQLAGARAVVSTLWQIPDEESAQLLVRFWESLAAGAAPDDAVRDAQLALIRERIEAGQTSHPFFWAAYTLTGRTTSRAR